MADDETDVNDEHVETDAQPAAPSREFNDLDISPASELITPKQLNPTWFLPSYLQHEQSMILFGEPNTGKTLLALQWAVQMAADNPGFVVIYFHNEGQAGIGARLRALEIERGISLKDMSVYIAKPPDLMNDRSIQRAVNEINSSAIDLPNVAIWDTLPGCHSGDENRSENAARILNNALHICETAIFLTHPGHRFKDRPRGATAFVGRVDVVVQLKTTKRPGVLALHTTKMRDGEKPADRLFGIKTVDLGITDAEGNRVTGPVMVELSKNAEPPKAEQTTLSAAQMVALQALRNAVEANGLAAPDEARNQVPAGQRIIDLTTWRAGAFQLGFPGKSGAAKGKGFKRAVQALLDQGIVETYDNKFFWPIGKTGQNVHLSAAGSGQIAHPPIGVGMSVRPGMGGALQ